MKDAPTVAEGFRRFLGGRRSLLVGVRFLRGARVLRCFGDLVNVEFGESTKLDRLDKD